MNFLNFFKQSGLSNECEDNQTHGSASALFKKNIVFSARHYEEWQGGQCISKGSLSVMITGKVVGNGIIFSSNVRTGLRLDLPCSFSFVGADILPDGRIQYINLNVDFNPTNPVVCQLFFKTNDLDYIRFAMTNPDRLVEFYR